MKAVYMNYMMKILRLRAKRFLAFFFLAFKKSKWTTGELKPKKIDLFTENNESWA